MPDIYLEDAGQNPEGPPATSKNSEQTSRLIPVKRHRGSRDRINTGPVCRLPPVSFYRHRYTGLMAKSGASRREASKQANNLFRYLCCIVYRLISLLACGDGTFEGRDRMATLWPRTGQAVPLRPCPSRVRTELPMNYLGTHCTFVGASPARPRRDRPLTSLASISKRCLLLADGVSGLLAVSPA